MVLWKTEYYKKKKNNNNNNTRNNMTNIDHGKWKNTICGIRANTTAKRWQEVSILHMSVNVGLQDTHPGGSSLKLS